MHDSPRATAGSILLVTLVFLNAGCFKSSTFQASSESSSDSSKSFSKSSSSSSPSDEEESAYAHDVRNVTARYARADGGARTIRRQISAVAERHGITDWEHDDATFLGIGRGLAAAGVNEAELAEIGLELSDADPERMASIRTGYDSSRAP